jgi:hypothetical protein
MKRKISSVTIVLWLLLTTLTVSAQSGGNYDLAWSSMAGGGGEAGGGSFALIGTIGQSEAGTLHGGSYTLSGGFLAERSLTSSVNYRAYLPVIMH